MFKMIFKSLPLHTTPPGRPVSSMLQSFWACYFASKTLQYGNYYLALGWIIFLLKEYDVFGVFLLKVFPHPKNYHHTQTLILLNREGKDWMGQDDWKRKIAGTLGCNEGASRPIPVLKGWGWFSLLSFKFFVICSSKPSSFGIVTTL